MPPGRTDDARNPFACVFRRRETDENGARGFRLLQDADGDFGDDAEQAFRAGDDAEKIVAAGVEMLAAEPKHLAGHQHHFEAQDVVGGHAVLQACLLYTSPSPRDGLLSRMPSSA